MPLIHSSSDKARSENIKELMDSNPNRSQKQAVAIGYAVQRKAEHEQMRDERVMHEKRKYGHE